MSDRSDRRRGSTSVEELYFGGEDLRSSVNIGSGERSTVRCCEALGGAELDGQQVETGEGRSPVLLEPVEAENHFEPVERDVDLILGVLSLP